MPLAHLTSLHVNLQEGPFSLRISKLKATLYSSPDLAPFCASHKLDFIELNAKYYRILISYRLFTDSKAPIHNNRTFFRA